MFQKLIAYLSGLGYTVEEQGKLEKYLVVFRSGRPLGLILSDLSVRMIADAEGKENIAEMIRFMKKNQSLPNVGGSEFQIACYRGNQLTTFFDPKTMLIKYTTYILDPKTGETASTIYESPETAAFRFVTQTGFVDVKRLLPQREGWTDRMRTRLIRYLVSKSNRPAEQ
ncbi:hypothetical protein EQM14_04800 [Caproiciproducens sp. NJN-50]|uniref:hypothetical protein n=1 Tax=Caproiciproducens sp. NJN-50 TaxID=2507162 RepID=UPI000FFE0EE6|nr:hypothetical protein [Caproiciproducens sp. NJN-50]QAT49147.1 hypothetical protein EQM14_04800 [Caproiciproducens sp. NJN-50]